MAPRAQAPRTTVRPDRSREITETPEPSERLRHLKIVGPRDRIRRSFRLTPRVGVTLTGLVFAALFLVAVSHALLIESQIRLDGLDEQVAEEESRYERLRRDVAELESPDRIVAEAQEMGMVVPDDTVWITPDQPAPVTTESDADAAGSDSTNTSWEDIKPHLGSTP